MENQGYVIGLCNWWDLLGSLFGLPTESERDLGQVYIVRVSHDTIRSLISGVLHKLWVPDTAGDSALLSRENRDGRPEMRGITNR